ncbi:MAG: ergothioneine biosynthesis protein EgtB [Pyrinomonadaceae bacterium]
MVSSAREISETQTASLIDLYQQVRARTMYVVAPLEIEDYVIQTADFMSPPRWHLGHTSWFFETLLQAHRPGYQIYSEQYLFYFNSYYEGFGPRIDRPKRGTRSRPTVKETVAYRRYIDEQMTDFLTELDDQSGRLPALVRLGLEHEMQHQELLVYDIKHLLCDQFDAQMNVAPSPVANPKGMAELKGGVFWLGADTNRKQFTFDNEKPRHQVFLQDYALDRAPVTNGDYLEFIRDGGYQDFRWWFSEGWETVNRENWVGPLYWELRDGQWLIRDFAGLHAVEEKSTEPVTHVSYYEASAYAKWIGRRLPTEAEWEKAACGDDREFPWANESPDESRANLFENGLWSVAAVGSLPSSTTPEGCQQMIGDVWEWTTSDYVPYPGFKSEFDEYNDKWFVNQKVLRGGSFATPRLHIRSTYRNFFHAHERWMISGFRCAKDI